MNDGLIVLARDTGIFFTPKLCDHPGDAENDGDVQGQRVGNERLCATAPGTAPVTLSQGSVFASQALACT